MFYQLKPTFEAVQEKPAEGVPWVEVITQQEMDSQVTQRPYLARSLRHGHSCKAELFDHCAAGACWCPGKNTRRGLDIPLRSFSRRTISPLWMTPAR